MAVLVLSCVMGKRNGAGRIVVVAVCAALLAGCGGASDSASTTKDETLATALGYLPADATTVRFGDSTAWLKAHGFAKKSTAELVKDEKFSRQIADAAFTESDLWQFWRVMTDWGWSAADIAWSATATTAKIPFLRYVRFRDSTDLDTVKKSLLAHNYRKHGDTFIGPPPFGTKEPQNPQIVLAIGHTVRFHPDKNLMVSSSTASLPELADGSKSLGSDPGVRTVVAPITTANFVSISTGADACTAPGRASSTPPKRPRGLGQVATSATAVVSDTKSTATVKYSSSDAAANDLPQRKKLVKGLSVRTNAPYSRYADFALTQKDSTIRYTIEAKPTVVSQMLYTRDAPWTMCGHPSKSSGRASAS